MRQSVASAKDLTLWLAAHEVVRQWERAALYDGSPSMALARLREAVRAPGLPSQFPRSQSEIAHDACECCHGDCDPNDCSGCPLDEVLPHA